MVRFKGCYLGRVIFVGIVFGTVYIVGLWQDFSATEVSHTHIPVPISVNTLYPSRQPLLNLTNFAYIINNDVCGQNKNVFAVVIVHTHPANRVRRDIMRQAIPEQDLNDLGLRRVFLLARAEWDDQELYQKTPQWQLDEENITNGDVIQGNFKEHYHNLTYKHIMGLQWTTRYCLQAKYIIKMDDDIAVDLYQLRNLLWTRYRERTKLILGLLQVDAKPVREQSSKWFVTRDQYPGDLYANFVSGWVYAMTKDAAAAIVRESLRQPYFWIDDVHVTGTLAEAVNVKREALNRFYTTQKDHLRCCLELVDSVDHYCDYFAGPCEGDRDLHLKVLQHARACYVDPCRRREKGQSVEKICVLVQGQPAISPIGKGHGDVVRIYRRWISPQKPQDFVATLAALNSEDINDMFSSHTTRILSASAS